MTMSDSKENQDDTGETVTPKMEEDRWRNRRRMAYISIVMLIAITVAAILTPDKVSKTETLLSNLAYTFGFIVAVGYMGAATFSHFGKK